MTVYVVVEEWFLDDSGEGLNTYVYDSLEKAQKKMNQLLTDFQFEYADCIRDNWEYNKGEKTGCWFREGEYAYDHFSVEIHTEEVK